MHHATLQIEARLHALPAGSPAAAALARAAAQAQGQPCVLPPGSLPARWLPQLPLAFELKSQAVTLWGLDLPAALPDVAGLPQRVQLLPSLVEEVAAAVAAAQRAEQAGDSSQAGACSHFFAPLLPL